MAEITIADLTTTTVDGNGVFDQLMRSVKAHIHEEYQKNRIRGPEYSTVYLSGLQSAMDQSIRFLMEKNNAALVEKQIELASKQLLKADKELALADKAIEKATKEIALVQAQIDKLATEQTLVAAQKAQIEAETLNVPKQGLMIDAQRQQVLADTLNTPKEGLVLDAQKCKLDADFDLTVAQKNRSTRESALIDQKLVTEKAQTQQGIADANSAIGRQNTVLDNQAAGFIRLAEQRATEIVSELLQVQIGVDQSAGLTDALSKSQVSEVFAKLKQGINA